MIFSLPRALQFSTLMPVYVLLFCSAGCFGILSVSVHNLLGKGR